MNTPSHILLHLGIRKFFRKKISIPRSFVYGSFAPDIGLYLCVFGYIFYAQIFLGNELSETFRHMFDTLYFEHPFWIFSYNILHAPLTLGIFLCLVKYFQDYLGEYYRVGVWFFLGCMLHTFLDIPLHHDDGPLIFYPLSDYSFSSPVSYWDANHYANYIIPLELLLCVSMISYLYVFPFVKKYICKT